MDSNRINSLASRLVEPNAHSSRRHEEEDDLDEDALFAELEDEIENDGNYNMREHGLDVMRQQMNKVKDMRQNEYGSYTEIMDEKEVIRTTANEPRCIVHFYHTDFKRCEIMDQHMRKLAPKYFTTRFFRVFVENIPWLVEKLGIKVLPCVIIFVKGVAKDRLIGFEDLGNNDSFSDGALELRLAQTGALQKPNSSGLEPIYQVASSKKHNYADDDEEFDL